ncbi:MAG: hypothetical protein JWM07_670 [Candidatus Saccharibacteria bacterium]|nr:hypothetical protein [Candidatus Saccharibacteria bacterium]
MTTERYAPFVKFERHNAQKIHELSIERMGTISLSLAELCIRYAGVERVPRYHEQHRENDAEHSLMVGVLAIELANELRPELDKGLISQYASIHDFIEIRVGDTPTYSLSEQELLDKHALEQNALQELVDILPPYIGGLLVEYEEQLTPESRFTRAVDKLTPLLVDILGPGKMVMREDYGITNVAQLITNKQRLDDSMVRRFGEDTPEIVELYQYLGDVFTKEYINSQS